MKQLLAMAALLGLAVGQFGGGFGGSGGQCDYQQLMRLAQAKEKCLEEGKGMMRDAMREVQRLDSTCNEGAVQLCEKCEPLANQIRQGQDLNVQGILECCMPQRFNGGGSRRCEWKDKPAPEGRRHHHGGRGHHGHHGHHGGGGHGGGGRGGGGGPPPMMDGPPPMEDMMDEMMKAKATLGGMVMKSMGMMGHMLNEKLSWCENEDRPVSRQAMEQVVRPWKDRLTAKLFSCYQPIMDVATNCTDVSGDALDCMERGFGWSCHAEKGCHMMCSEDSLEVFCNAYTQAAQASGSRGGNGGGNNGRFFDPFKFNNA